MLLYRSILLCLLPIFLYSCTDKDFAGMLRATSPDADIRFGDSMDRLPPSGIRTVLDSDSEEYSLYLCSDIHLETSTEIIDAVVGAFLSDSSRPLAFLCLGDLVSDKEKYFLLNEHIEPVRDRFYTTAGNHDLFKGAWDSFLEHYGPSVYCVEVHTPSGASDLMIFLDSAGATLGSRQMEWLEYQVFATIVAKSQFRHITVLTHTCVLAQDVVTGIAGSFAQEESYHLARLFSEYKVEQVLAGHLHHREDFVFKGVRYVVHESLDTSGNESGYAVWHFGPSSADVEFVENQNNH